MLRYNPARAATAGSAHVAEADDRARACLRERVARGIRDDGDDGVAAGHGAVGAENDGQPVRRDLDRTRQHALARQLPRTVSGAPERCARETDADAIGRGGGYAIPVGEDHEESAVGFSLYPDPLISKGLGQPHIAPPVLFLPLGHDAEVAARLRAIGWRTVAALSGSEDAKALGCTHRLDGSEAVRL